MLKKRKISLQKIVIEFLNLKLQILTPESAFRFKKTTKLYMGDCYVGS